MLALFFSLIFVFISSLFSSLQATNAGILPYAKKDGQILICLGYGKSLVGTSWELLWSDFGGTADPGETTEDTAAREAHEESIGTFYLLAGKDTLADTINYNGGVEFFKNKLKGASKIERSWINEKTKKTESYTLFVIEVPFVDPKDFAKTRLTVQKRKIEQEYLDKFSIGWVDVTELQTETANKTYDTSKNIMVNNVSTNKNITLYHQLVLGLTTPQGQVILKNLAQMADPQKQLSEKIKALISQKADVNAKTSGNTPLHSVIAFATQDLNAYISNNLLKPNFSEEFDKKIKIYLELAKMLKDAGADTSIINDAGKTPTDLIDYNVQDLKLSSAISGSALDKFRIFFVDLKEILEPLSPLTSKLITLKTKLQGLKDNLFELSKKLKALKAGL